MRGKLGRLNGKRKNKKTRTCCKRRAISLVEQRDSPHHLWWGNGGYRPPAASAAGAGLIQLSSSCVFLGIEHGLCACTERLSPSFSEVLAHKPCSISLVPVHITEYIVLKIGYLWIVVQCLIICCMPNSFFHGLPATQTANT